MIGVKDGVARMLYKSYKGNLILIRYDNDNTDYCTEEVVYQKNVTYESAMDIAKLYNLSDFGFVDDFKWYFIMNGNHYIIKRVWHNFEEETYRTLMDVKIFRKAKEWRII
ncbi:MAG: hypothetical protein NC311_10765 [Muribaculaceae bacterium]|nr:hypothetical protein [Muribaculaceae bacterium]